MKGCVFDLDGTLLNSLEDIADAANDVLRSNGFPVHPVLSYGIFVGDGLGVLFQRICPAGTSDTTLAQCCSQFKKTYDHHWHMKSRLYPGIKEMLLQLKEREIKLAILSNKPHQFTVQCVEYFFPENLFDLYYGQRESVAKKPDPEGLLEIVQKFELSLSDVMYVGDSSVDILTGRNCGVFTVGVNWGFRPVKELQEHGADRIVKSPEELLQQFI